MTPGIISSKGTIVTLTSPHANLNARYALVPRPGIAMVTDLASSIDMAVRETKIGPYPSPMEAPQFISSYLSAIRGYE